MTDQLCDAVRRRQLLSLTYGGLPRVVEPYIHGHTTAGREVLLCYQREGETASKQKGWRLLHVDEMIDVALLATTFVFDQPNYDENAREIRFVHCRVPKLAK